MDHITIRVSNINLARLQHHAHTHGRTGASVITEWTRVLVEYPDDAMRILAKLVSELPSTPKEHDSGDELEAIRRRAGLRRRRRRDENPVVTVNRTADANRHDDGGMLANAYANIGASTAGAASTSAAIGAPGMTSNGSGF